VSLAWRQKWPRLTRMSWDELRTRLRQELNKRLDASIYRLGLQPSRMVLDQSRSSPKFFFSQADLTERVRLLQKHLPLEVVRILNEADQICGHHFSLLGYTALDYGAAIDWHRDAVHAKRAPLKPWFKIDFLNFAEVGDHKIIWELNRHQHLVTLAKAWLVAGEKRYLTELITQWYAWQRQNPYPFGINWASSLEIAFRSLSWIWIRSLLAGGAAVPVNFNTDILRGLALNGRHIERYLSTYFSPNTHLLGEAVALFFIGTLCPEIPAASRWREVGLQILLEQAGRQVGADGVHFEGSLYYHVYALDFFMHTRLLALRNEIDIPPAFDESIRRMLAVVKALSQNGPPDGCGDDDGGRVFNPRRNRAEHMTDPLAIGAMLFPNAEPQAMATLTEEAIWLFGGQATSRLLAAAFVAPSRRSECFPHGGIYISASSGDAAQQVIVQAGRQHTTPSGHDHADALSVKLWLQRRRWLIDSGTCCYIGPGDERNLFRGTGAHNTLRVDGLDQAVPAGPFAWNDRPSVRVESWVGGETFTFFSGSHSGYSRLRYPVLHRRVVVHIHDRFSMVRDIAQGNETHELEISWHFVPELIVTRAGAGFIVALPAPPEPHAKLALVLAEDPAWNSQLTTGQVSPAYGVTEPAQVLRRRARLGLPAEHAVIFQPITQAPEAPGKLLSWGTQPAEQAAVYQYNHNDRTHTMIFADRKQSWNWNEWASDAAFFYCCAEAQRVSHLAVSHASFVDFRGKSLLHHSQILERFEYLEADGKRQISSSQPGPLNLFSETALESSNPVL
jgi:Heparinase II/III-like protein/Heparinase II/III N-terminus